MPATRGDNNELMLFAIVWQAASCQCEYWTRRQRRSGGFLRLLIGGHVALERDVLGVDDMLSLAWRWRRTLVSRQSLPEEAWRRSNGENRRRLADRRAFPRGGRRRFDLSPSVGLHAAN
jgi:hypothetical protein